MCKPFDIVRAAASHLRERSYMLGEIDSELKEGNMRGAHVKAAVAATLVALVLSASAGAATSIHGTFVTHFGRGVGASNGSCPANTFCGAGSLSGYGEGTQLTDFVSFVPIDDTPCANVEIVQTITVVAGTLVLDETGTFCSPGASDGAPSSPGDYGHPHVMDLTFVVDGASSTGAFAEASGSGSEHVQIAGDVAVSTLSGTISLAP
jgi:hypothetical protein